MDEGSSNLQGNITKQGGSTQLFQNTHTPENLPMVEEICIKTEGSSTADDNSDKAEGCSLKMDVSSPVGKMEMDSPKSDVLSMKMDVVSPKMEATSPSMDISSPNMEVSSPTMEVSSPNAEEGSAKMEEVAVKMGEVSVKSEERGSAKDNTNMEQGSEKMEEVAVKMGEVSVKADGSMIDDIPSAKGSVKMEEVSVKMEKVSVQSEQGSPKEETHGDSEKKIQHYRGVACVTEGEVPDWLTVDLLVRAIRNDKPGTKKPQIRPFGSPAPKTRAASHGHPANKVQSHQMGSPYNNPLLNRPSGSHMLGEPSTSHVVARPSSSPSASRGSSSQTVSRTSASESAGKPSTSQSSGNKLPNSQSSNKPSSSCASDRPSSTAPERSTSSQSKGKAGPGVRVKGKSSLSLHKGKAPVGETSSRASSSSVEGRDSGNGSEGGSSAGVSGLSDDSGSKSSDNSAEYMNTNKDCENKICDIQGRTSSIFERQSSSDENKDTENIGSKLSDDNSEEKFVDCSAEDGAPSSSLTCNTVENPSGSRSELEKTEALGTFKKPVDPPKRSLKKPGVPLKGAVRKQVDPSKDTFKKPIDPPKRTLKKPNDSSKMIKKASEPPKVRFKKPEVSPKDAVQKATETPRTVFRNAEEVAKGTFKKPFDPPKHTAKKATTTTTTTPKKPKQPPLQVIRFISQRLSSGNTVYRVRATAVRGSVARDCHLVVKRCSNAAEVTYYKKVAPRIPYVPRVLLCDKNIVVMDDLVHEGFRRPRGKFTPAQMNVAIDGLAHMHTASVIALKRDPSLLEAFPQAAKATESDIARDLRMLADRVKSWSFPDADYYAARCRALAECVPYLLERLEPADTNMTVLLHGNVSPRNVFFLYDSRNPRLPAMASFVDFANVYWGHPALDISLVTGRAGGFWEGYKIVLLSLLTRASGRMWMPQPEIKDCGETYAFALLRAVCSSVSGSAAKVLEARLQELFPVFRQYSWLDFW